jgi:hypothetical protein
MNVQVQLNLSVFFGTARVRAASSVAIGILVGSMASACGAPKPTLPAELIGLIQQSNDRQPTIAVFRDAASHAVFYGREGDLILQRYRIRRVTVDSVELLDTDKTRQTIVLTLSGDDEPRQTQKGRS